MCHPHLQLAATIVTGMEGIGLKSELSLPSHPWREVEAVTAGERAEKGIKPSPARSRRQ